MSDEQEQPLTTVAQHAQLSVGGGRASTEATLPTLAERLSAGEARDLAAKLPREIAPWLRTEGRAEGFGADEFVRRVAKREGTDPTTAARHAGAVFAALERAVGPARGRRHDVRARLRRAVEAVLETLGERIWGGEAQGMIATAEPNAVPSAGCTAMCR